MQVADWMCVDICVVCMYGYGYGYYYHSPTRKSNCMQMQVTCVSIRVRMLSFARRSSHFFVLRRFFWRNSPFFISSEPADNSDSNDMKIVKFRSETTKNGIQMQMHSTRINYIDMTSYVLRVQYAGRFHPAFAEVDQWLPTWQWLQVGVGIIFL